MTRSTKVSLKFANAGKRQAVSEFISEYRRVAAVYMDALWSMDKLPKLLPASLQPEVDTWLSARALQCLGKQISAIIRGTRQKNAQRAYVVAKLQANGEHKKARKLQSVIDKHPMSKPDANLINPELDERFTKIDLVNSCTKSYDGWVRLGSIGRKQVFELPFKRTKHLNKLSELGRIRPGIRLSDTSMTLMFEIPDRPEKKTGTTLGVDIGVNAILSCSDGKQVTENRHGHSMKTITDRLARKKKGSKSFLRSVRHRENFIGWATNNIDFSNVRQLNIENIKNLRRGRNAGRRLSHFIYPLVFGRLENTCELNGVRVKQVSPTYTSQRCSACGWVRKSNRKGERFVCGKCGNALNADMNASRNIALDLPPISAGERRKQNNRIGFYWNATGQEPIVSVAHKVNHLE